MDNVILTETGMFKLQLGQSIIFKIYNCEYDFSSLDTKLLFIMARQELVAANLTYRARPVTRSVGDCLVMITDLMYIGGQRAV